MKSLLLIAASSLALSAAACAPSGKPAARAALDCPNRQGDLTRTGVAPDRKSCTYRAADGGEVTLQLVATNGDPQGALKAIESNLSMPAPGAAAPPATPAKSADEIKTADVAKTTEVARIAKEARADAGKIDPDWDKDDDDDVNVHIPGVHIEAHDGHGSSDSAHIDLPGLHINADGDDNADIRVGGVSVNAKDDKVTVRMFREVRLRGEALSRERRGLRATYIYTGKNMPSGYKFVGYEAAGPKAGPLTVAVVRSNLESDAHDGVYRDVKRLVRRNGGV